MGQSYRIKTELGVNKTINVQLEQDFEFLEILSLKIQQADVYTRSCADYGVIVGRVTANNGFGIPNARVSVFIPISAVDESNPLISSIYPYKSPTDKNEDGYRYNLLPYEKSYSAHAATGTLPTRADSLTGATAVEIYDTYYKYTTKTNESGDYMIMGAPLGAQTLVMDVDLSDIGEFSLTPQDLIRMGLATEGQVAGNRFKTSTDLSSLPQIVSLTKQLEVSPLWGDPDICQIAVNRMDFDLRDDANIDIQPTSVFMGSIYSTADEFRVRKNAKPRDDMGNLCSLNAGPGQILAIRQTIQEDSDGNPILEQFQLEQSGNIIDGNGVWMTELPMNLDYFITNEFGEKVLSNDPTVGIPTKGRYRFKVKWSQSAGVSEQTRRPNYLIPNVKEYGWGSGSVNSPARQEGSYYFGLDWSGYTKGFVGFTSSNVQQRNQLLDSKINCEDTFYEFKFNRVYTVAGFIDEFKNGAKGRFIGIKEIDSNECATTINKFPVNDGFRNFDLLFFIFAILMQIIQLVGLVILIVYHFVAFLWNNFAVPILAYFIVQFGFNSYFEFQAAYAAAAGATSFSWGLLLLITPFILKGILWAAIALFLGFNFRKITSYKFGRLKLPMMQYPDCQACSCDGETTEPGGGTGTNESPPQTGLLSQVSNRNFYYDETINYQSNLNATVFSQYGANMAGEERQMNYPGCGGGWGGGGRNTYPCDPYSEETIDEYNTIAGNMKVAALAGNLNKINVSGVAQYSNGVKEFAVGYSIPPGERINIYNTRGKYFTGENKIKVTFSKPNNGTTHHFDNTLTVLSTQDLQVGEMVSFIDISKSKDVNFLYTGTTTVGGRLINGINGVINTNQQSVNVTYATSQTQGSQVLYTLPQITGYTCVDSVTISASTDGTVTYQTCPGYTVTNVVTTGTTTFTNEYGIDISTTGGTAEYVVIASGQTLQRYIYPSDIEYYQVLTAITITTTVVNGVTTYTNPNFNGTTGFWGALNAPNTIQVWNEIDGDGWGVVRPTENVPTTTFTDLVEQKVLILQRGVDPNSPKYLNQYGIGKILGYSNEDNVTITGYTRLNIPIQPLNTSTNGNISVQNHRNQNNIFYPPYVYTPGIPNSTYVGDIWSGFTTDNVGYYGSLDSQNFPTGIFPVLQGFSNGGVTGLRTTSSGTQAGGNRYYSASVANNRYDSSEDLSGAAVIWGDYSSSFRQRVPSLIWFLNGDYVGGRRYHGFPESSYVSPVLYPSFTGFSTSTSGQLSITNSNGYRTVMRTDRLPSSDYSDYKKGFTSGQNSSLLQQNLGFAVYSVDSGIGYAVTTTAFSTGADIVTADIGGQVAALNVVSSLNSCENMVGLTCYQGNGTNFGVRPGCQADDYVENGCYVMVNRPLEDLSQDIKTFNEWAFRFRFFYGLCRGVLSQSFVNNWVNGSLYMFPIQVDIEYDSNNQPSTPQFATQLVYFDKSSNNFYYRSSPFRLNNTSSIDGDFIGLPPTGQSSPTNQRQLLFPTTIINLGIKDDFYQEIIFDPSAKGYIMKSLNSTSYSDTSDLVNLFVISRITDESFLQQLISFNPNNNLDQLFSRQYKRIDGDLAQTMSINSEFGVIPFSPEFYSSLGLPSDPVQILGSLGNPTMAIYFSSTTFDLQNKDYLSPGVIDFRPSNNANALTYYYGIKSQEVPYYQWTRDTNPTTGVFGTQDNNWATNYSTNSSSSGIFSYPYQSLNRRDDGITHPSYFIPSNTALSDTFARGYIFNLSAQTYTDFTYSATYGYNTWSGRNKFLVGAPNHFYFGLIKGESALDKFKEKYSIDE
jgi:hypothetical protein